MRLSFALVAVLSFAPAARPQAPAERLSPDEKQRKEIRERIPADAAKQWEKQGFGIIAVGVDLVNRMPEPQTGRYDYYDLPFFYTAKPNEADFTKLVDPKVPFGIVISSYSNTPVELSLKPLEKLKSLEALYLYDHFAAGFTAARMKDFPALSNLKSLRIGVAKDYNAVLAKIGGFANLEELAVSQRGGADEKNPMKLAPLGALKKLRVFKLESGLLEPGGTKALGLMTKLQHLHLGAFLPKGQWIGEAELKPLASLKNLESFYLQSQAVTGKSLKHLANNAGLKDLTLNGFKPEVELSKTIGGFANLERLDLSYSPLTDKDMAHFAGLTNLKSFHTYNTAITDKGVEHMANWSEIEKLSLGKSKITDASVAAFKGMSNLTRLDVHLTDVTPEATKALRQKNLDVYHGDKKK